MKSAPRPRFSRSARPPSFRRADARRGFTLVEIMVAALVLMLLSGGLLATLIQTRKLTEGSLLQNSANTIMQGYIEQIKNMEFADLPYTVGTTVMPGSVAGSPSTLLTRSIARVSKSGGGMENVIDPLLISTAATTPASSEILKTATPVGVVENVKVFDVNNTPDNDKDDLRLRMWIWIRDISNPAVDATQVRGITVIYSWRANNAAQARSFVGTIRSIRSAVPTF